MINLRYFARCAANLVRYGRSSEYVARYGYAKTISDIAHVRVRSHWLVG